MPAAIPSSRPRRVAVITGTRAEYGLLRVLLQRLAADSRAALQLIVTGTHLSPAHGYTVQAIEADGIPIAARLDLALSGDSPRDIAAITARALAQIADSLNTLAPDMLLVLGDRYESFAAASAAALLRIPIAHLHGGELTEGAIDEQLRHAITKLATWHFVSAEAYATRVIQMGETPERVFCYGAPGLDALADTSVMPPEMVSQNIGIALENPVFLITYHPETLSLVPPAEQVEALLSALAHFPQATCIISGANADAGGEAINTRLRAFAAARPRTCFKPSYGSALYLNLLRVCDVVIGNSSSGVIEAAALGKACVNIGNRQKGRLRLPSVMDSACETKAIRAAIDAALSKDFRTGLAPSDAFGTPGSISRRIAEALVTLPLPETTAKPFYDVPGFR